MPIEARYVTASIDYGMMELSAKHRKTNVSWTSANLQGLAKRSGVHIRGRLWRGGSCLLNTTENSALFGMVEIGLVKILQSDIQKIFRTIGTTVRKILEIYCR